VRQVGISLRAGLGAPITSSAPMPIMGEVTLFDSERALFASRQMEVNFIAGRPTVSTLAQTSQAEGFVLSPSPRSAP